MVLTKQLKAYNSCSCVCLAFLSICGYCWFHLVLECSFTQFFPAKTMKNNSCGLPPGQKSTWSSLRKQPHMSFKDGGRILIKSSNNIIIIPKTWEHFISKFHYHQPQRECCQRTKRIHLFPQPMHLGFSLATRKKVETPSRKFLLGILGTNGGQLWNHSGGNLRGIL